MQTDTTKKTPTARSQSTSVESRDRLEPKNKNKYRDLIYQFIKSGGPKTCDEVEVSLGLLHQTASCYIRFLTRDGFLCDSGARRLTRSGRKAIVWDVVKSEMQGDLFI